MICYMGYSGVYRTIKQNGIKRLRGGWRRCANISGDDHDQDEGRVLGSGTISMQFMECTRSGN